MTAGRVAPPPPLPALPRRADEPPCECGSGGEEEGRISSAAPKAASPSTPLPLLLLLMMLLLMLLLFPLAADAGGTSAADEAEAIRECRCTSPP